ncbi:MAG: NAD(P)H-hydrate dehydratase [Lysobacterales bacterium]
MPTQVPLASIAQIRALEARAIAELDGDAFALMQRAGRSAWDHARIHFPGARRWIVCCGTGNNGGDGYLLAVHAARAGIEVRLLRTGEPATVEAARAAAECAAASIPMSLFEGDPLPAGDLLIDAVLGIGIKEAPRADTARLIDAINVHAATVYSLDVPSGLDADRGCAPGRCVEAAHTLTFLARKPGLLTGAGSCCSGEVSLADLGVTFVADQGAGSISLLTGRAADALPLRRPDDHKGRYGRALLIGGDHGMGGAIALAGEACARVGAGVTSVATRGMHVGALLARRPELMVHGDEDGDDHTAADEALLERANVIGIGPGLGQAEWGRRWMQSALASNAVRVFDADALNSLAANPVRLRPDDVITPHPGEAARLLGCTASDVENDRISAARELANRFGAICVLKGAGTVIADPDGRVALSPHAVPALATAGSGDVLTGIITGLRAQGIDAWHAACIGVLAHAECGLHASARHGARGVLAGDLAAYLPIVLNR